MYKFYNPNPNATRVGDCTIRSICCALGLEWDKTYLDLCLYGLLSCDLPSANSVWGKYLVDNGFRRNIMPDTCPLCYTVKQFAEDHPSGTYILALNGHVVAVKNGDYYDSWDSGDEIPVYYWEKVK